MAQPLPNHPNLRGGFAPLQMECDVNDLVIEGQIPKELNGSFYRNGPNPSTRLGVTTIGLLATAWFTPFI